MGKPVYSEPIPSYGDVMTVDEFRAACEQGAFIDYDGYGYPAKNGKIDRRMALYPSELWRIPKDATHIVWFNR